MPWWARRVAPPHTTTSPLSRRMRRGPSFRLAPPNRNTAGSPNSVKPVGLIPLRVAANPLVLSADGRTFYSIDSNSTAKNQVFAIDVATGKTLRVYQTKNPIWFPYPLVVSPNQSQIYVSTCSSSIDGATCEGGNVEVLDVASGLDLAVISMGSDQVFQIAAAPNGAAVRSE